MTTSASDWGRAMATAALEIRGEPTSRQGDQWRYGSHGSLVVNVSGSHAGHWHSFEDNTGGGVLDFLKHQLGLDREKAWEWLKERRLVGEESRSPISAPRPFHPPPAKQASKKQVRREQRLRIFASDLWSASDQIPPYPDHATRQWLEARNLWRPELPLPGAVRWIPSSITLFRGLHQGTGSIAIIMAPPEAWARAWPAPPELTAIHLVNIDKTGQPALDRPANYIDPRGNPQRGLSKRTYGYATSTVAVLGNPILEETSTPIRIIEGLADGLALAARFEGPIIASIGTPTRLAKDANLAAWLATAPYGVVIHSDADEPGQKAARALRRTLQDAGTQVRAVLPPEGAGKDSADIARHNLFVPLSESWADYASTLTKMHPTWPRWEVARHASIITAGDSDDQ